MNWPYLTDPNLKISGKFKSSEEDFIVEEIPSYLPTGSGEHLYIFLEKTGLTTDQVIQQLSRALGIKTMHIGFAGKKDRVGITRQWFSLLKVSQSRVEKLDIPGVRILKMDFHKNKLRPGHLKGNRFTIYLQNAEKKSLAIVKQILEKLECIGVANYFGPQRFGVKGDNPAIGLAILQKEWQKVLYHILGNPNENDRSAQILEARELFERGEYKKALELWPNNQFFAKTALHRLIENQGDFEKTGRQLPKGQLKFFLNSLQSFWFNHCLAKRLLDLNQIWQGDLAYLHRNGAVFRVADAAQEQPRIGAFEISPSGPVFGLKMIQPEGKELDLENNVLQEQHFCFDDLMPSFRRWQLNGERRSYRVQLKNVAYSQEKDCIKLSFDLDSGSYATSVVRELLKDNFDEPEVTLQRA